MALAVCYSRILLGKHYLSDVLAAIGTATLLFPLAVAAVNAVAVRVPRSALPVAEKIWAALLLALALLFPFL
jgi:membrane-associated phospholipid phosphatase